MQRPTPAASSPLLRTGPSQRSCTLGGASGGLWRSLDEGNSWEPIYDELTHPSVSTIATSKTTAGEVWVGTGDVANGYSGQGAPTLGLLYSSMDAGQTWTREDFAPGVRHAWVSRVALQADASGATTVVFAATDRGLYRRSGASWSVVLSRPITDVAIVGVPFSSTYTVVAAGPGGLWSSPSQGVAGSFALRPLPGLTGLRGRTTLGTSRTGLHQTFTRASRPWGGGWAGISGRQTRV